MAGTAAISLHTQEKARQSMTVKNRKLLIQTIEEDCDIAHLYINREGQTCALGGLGKAAGFPLDHASANAWNMSAIVSRYGPKDYMPAGLRVMRSAIHRKFGLTIEQQKRIQEINDGHAYPNGLPTQPYEMLALTPEERKARRRAHILEYVATLP